MNDKYLNKDHIISTIFCSSVSNIVLYQKTIIILDPN